VSKAGIVLIGSIVAIISIRAGSGTFNTALCGLLCLHELDDLIDSLLNGRNIMIDFLEVMLHHLLQLLVVVRDIAVLQTRDVASCLVLTLEHFFLGIQEFAVFCRRMIMILNVICLHGRQLCNHTSHSI
jgi:hypothetical protein